MSLFSIITICMFIIVLAIFLGYKIAMWQWKPKDIIKNWKDMIETNENYSKEMNKINEANRKQYEWFCYQLFEIGKWVKEKYKDDYIIEELRKLPDHQNIVLENLSNEEKINKILDKIRDNGMKSLSDIEKKFLNDLQKGSF